jgi:multicomponent Na+:H+ antiporter subunit A
MVKAGVFLLARLSPVWSGTAPWVVALTGAGALTMLMSAWAGLRYRDLKTILAYTTTMALGLFVMLLGLGDEGSVKAAAAYLLVHALYKGSLFMTAGGVDHAVHTRDVEQLSGLRGKMPFTALAAGLACASMAGLPPFLGFVGKEAAYEANLHLGALGGPILGVSLLANAALFGVAGVLALRPFFGAPSEKARHAHESDLPLLAGPLVLGLLGLGFGLAPGLLDGLMGAVASSVRGEVVHVHLALWHGLTPALYASLATYALGGLVYGLSGRLRASPGFGAAVDTFTEGPPRAFEAGLIGLSRLAATGTRRFYVGRLRIYAFVVLMTLLGAGWFVLARTGALGVPSFGTIRPHEAMLLAILVISSAVATLVEPAMRAIIAVGLSGYCVALIYLLFGAPDVAMTQFAIETLTVILVVLTLLHLPSAAFQRSRRRSIALDVAVSFGLGGLVAALLLGVLGGDLPSYVSEWYLAHSAPDAHGHNVVNVILVDFRGFDTWGEITVLTIAGLGVYALLRRRSRWSLEG